MRRTLWLCGFLALYLVTTVADVQASQVRRGSRRTVCPAAARRAEAKPRATPSVARVRQIDGKSLWDLGMQNGQWPKLP